MNDKSEYGYFHITMGALKDRLLFSTDREYRYGVNALAATLQGYDVKILCYCLMSNHLHILLSGNKDTCIQFYNTYIRTLSRIIASEKGKALGLVRADYEIVEINSLVQFRNVVVYILRNPLKAGVASPLSYEWSPAGVLLCPFIRTVSGKKVGELSFKEYRKIFRTHSRFPDNYEYLNGVILDKCFVSYEEVLSRFDSEIALFYLLGRSSIEFDVEDAAGISSRLQYSDTELSERIGIILSREFHVSSLSELTSDQIIRLIKIIRKRFYPGKSQIGRLLGIKMDILDRLF